MAVDVEWHKRQKVVFSRTIENVSSRRAPALVICSLAGGAQSARIIGAYFGRVFHPCMGYTVISHWERGTWDLLDSLECKLVAPCFCGQLAQGDHVSSFMR